MEGYTRKIFGKKIKRTIFYVYRPLYLMIEELVVDGHSEFGAVVV